MILKVTITKRSFVKNRNGKINALQMLVFIQAFVGELELEFHVLWRFDRVLPC